MIVSGIKGPITKARTAFRPAVRQAALEAITTGLQRLGILVARPGSSSSQTPGVIVDPLQLTIHPGFIARVVRGEGSVLDLLREISGAAEKGAFAVITKAIIDKWLNMQARANKKEVTIERLQEEAGTPEFLQRALEQGIAA